MELRNASMGPLYFFNLEHCNINHRKVYQIDVCLGCISDNFTMFGSILQLLAILSLIDGHVELG